MLVRPKVFRCRCVLNTARCWEASNSLSLGCTSTAANSSDRFCQKSSLTLKSQWDRPVTGCWLQNCNKLYTIWICNIPLWYMYILIPIHEACSASGWIRAFGCWSCGNMTAENPNTVPARNCWKAMTLVVKVCVITKMIFFLIAIKVTAGICKNRKTIVNEWERWLMYHCRVSHL